METFSKRLSPDEVLDILKKHFKVKDARVLSYHDHGGLSWAGLGFYGYDKPVAKKAFDNKFYRLEASHPNRITMDELIHGIDEAEALKQQWEEDGWEVEMIEDD